MSLRRKKRQSHGLFLRKVSSWQTLDKVSTGAINKLILRSKKELRKWWWNLANKYVRDCSL